MVLGFGENSGLLLAPWIPLSLPWSIPDLETNKKLPLWTFERIKFNTDLESRGLARP